MFQNKTYILDDNRNIAPGIKGKDLDGMDFNQIVDFFDKRIKAFYIKPGNHLKKKKYSRRKWFLRKRWDSDFGFILITISSILIDLLSQYETGLPQGKESDYVSYLGKAINEFSKNFSKIGKLYYNDRGILKNPIAVNVNKASVFYSGFRCGIVHNAIVLTSGSYDETPATITREKTWADAINQDHNELVVHPIKLFEELVEVFNEYIRKLKNPLPLYKSLRDSFKNKFLLDFGYGP